MQSKICFFSPTLFKKNVLSFIAIPITYLFAMVIANPIMLFTELNSYYTTPDLYLNVIQTNICTNTNPLLVSFAALIGMITVFYFLYNTKHTYMIHALPLSRKSLFITNIASVSVMLFVPQFIIAVVYSLQINNYVGPKYIWIAWIWLLFTMMMGCLFMSIALLAIMFTGQLITAGFFFFVINFIYAICYNSINLARNALTFGSLGYYLGFGVSIFTPYHSLWSSVGIVPDDGSSFSILYSNYSNDTVFTVSGWSTFGIYLAVSVALTIAAWFCYKHRHLEVAGSFLSFKWLGYIFRWGVSAVISIVFGYIIAYANNNSSDVMGTIRMCTIFLIATVLLGIVIFIVAEMIVKKSFRVFTKSFWIECGAYTFVMILVSIIIYSGALGYQKKIPAKEDIKAASISSNYYEDVRTNETIIDTTLACHKLILENIDELKNTAYEYGEENGEYVTIRYVLNNGSAFGRKYYLPAKTDNATINNMHAEFSKLISDSSYIKAYYHLDDGRTISWAEVDTFIYDDDNMPAIESKEIDTNHISGLVDAIYADIEEGNLNLMTSTDDQTVNAICLYFIPREDFLARKEIYYYSPGEIYVYINPTPECKNICNYLVDNGLIDNADDFITNAEYFSRINQYYETADSVSEY